MSGNRNDFQPLTDTTTAPTGLFSASASGIVGGTTQASKVITDAIGVSATQTFRRDQLIQVLDALIKRREAPENIEALKIFGELKDSLNGTAKSVETTVSGISVAPSVTVIEGSQLSVDSVFAVSAVSRSTDDPRKFTQFQACTLKLDEQANGFSANCKNLSNEFGNIFDQISNHVPNELGHSHGNIAKSTAATSALATIAPSALISLGLDSIGSVLRECSATDKCVGDESHASKEEKNIYKALSACSQVFTTTKDLAASLQALKALRDAIWNVDHVSKMWERHSVSTPLTSAIVRGLISTPFVLALESVIASGEAVHLSSAALTQQKNALSESATQGILKASSIKGSDGGNTHSQNITLLTNEFKKVIEAIPEEHSTANNSATLSVRTISALTAVPSLMTALAGILSRELSGTVDFITNDKVTHQALTDVLKSDKAHTGKHLDELMSAVCDMKERIKKCQELGVSAPFTLGGSHTVTCGSLVASLNAAAGMCFALSELRSFTHPDASAGLKPKEHEIQKAEEYKEDVKKFNQDSAASSQTASASEHLSLHDHLQSIMEKVVLTNRVSFDDFQPGAENINRSGHSLINTTQMNTTGFLSGALGVLALVCLESGISMEAFWRALGLATEKSNILSKGPDEIKTGTSHFNLSIPSNATRITADESKAPESSATQTSLSTTHDVSEVALSRSLTIAICQSGALTKALKELSKEVEIGEGEPHPEYFLGSSFTSGRVMSERLAQKIKEVFDQAGNKIPGLNQDMANQLASASQASITAALSTHSSLIAPFLQSYAVIKKAFKNVDQEQKNEGLSKSSIVRDISTASNTIQAFTRNCIAQLKQNANDRSHGEKDKVYNTSMQTHIGSNASLASTMMATCYISLLCDEMLESIISRSFTLLDAEKIRNTTKKSAKASGDEAKEASHQSAEDSNLGKSNSATFMISALRLTLSHLGESLAGMAADLQNGEASDLQKENLQMHTSQRSMLKSLASALSKCSLGMTRAAGTLSMLPLSSLHSIDEMRHIVRSIDSVRANYSHSAESTREDKNVESSGMDSGDSESSVSFGMTIDSTTATLLLFAKSLLKGLVLGSESALLVSKILEIISLHPRPDMALSLLVQELLQPQGGSTGLTKLVESQLTGATVGLSATVASVLNDVNTSDSTKTTQKTTHDSLQEQIIDKLIDACGFLEDAEESKETLGLKKLFELMIMVLAEHSDKLKKTDITPYNAESLAAMLNRGSITLASYHSKTLENPLISNETFLGCNDAQVLLETFIRKASADQSLMRKLKKALQGENYSTKVEKLWGYIVDKTCDNLNTQTRSARFSYPGVLHAEKRFKPKDFRDEYTLQKQVNALQPK